MCHKILLHRPRPAGQRDRHGGQGENIRLRLFLDLTGNKTKDTDENGAATTYGYDKLNRPTGSAITVHGADGAAVAHKTALTYDANGNKLSEKDWRGNERTFVYDRINRLTERRDPSGTVIETLGYNDGNLQTRSKDAFTFPLQNSVTAWHRR